MIRDKIIFLALPQLLIVFSGLLVFVGKAEAQLVLPTSIHEILEPAQIDALKAREDVKAMKTEMRTKIMGETKLKVLLDKATLELLFPDISPYPDVTNVAKTVYEDVGGKIMSAINLENTQRIFFTDPTNPEGLAIRFAPSDEELVK